MNEQIHFTGQYLAYKSVYADYRKIRNKDKFYEEHLAELSLYDTALRTLKEKSNGNKLPSMKALYAEKDRLTELRDTQREDFHLIVFFPTQKIAAQSTLHDFRSHNNMWQSSSVSEPM